MTFGEKRKVIVFNLDRDVERELYQFANTIAFGPVVKKYLLADMHKRMLPKPEKASIQVQLDG